MTHKALRSLARRWQQRDAEVRELDVDLKRLTGGAAPRLLNDPGIGPETATKLLIVAGDNQTDCAPTPRSRPSAAPLRSKPQAARRAATASTLAAIANATAGSRRSPPTACSTTGDQQPRLRGRAEHYGLRTRLRPVKAWRPGKSGSKTPVQLRESPGSSRTSTGNASSHSDSACSAETPARTLISTRNRLLAANSGDQTGPNDRLTPASRSPRKATWR